MFSVVAALFLVLDFFFTILCLIISKKPLISISQSLMPFDVPLGIESSVYLEEISFISIALMTGSNFILVRLSTTESSAFVESAKITEV